jgi:hypothetical protein
VNRRDVALAFPKDVAAHAMTVIRSIGTDRHLRFRRPGTNCMWFDLVTWPGVLVIHGDMGTYVFSRIEDMFAFFRGDGINPGYWSEKVQGDSRNGRGTNEFSAEAFVEAVKSDHRAWWRGRTKSRADVEARRECWREVRASVLHAHYDGGHAAVQAAVDFEFQSGEHRFQFQDFWEHSLTESTYHFLWCCHAIVWGIQQFDNATSPSQLATPEPEPGHAEQEDGS